MSSTHITEITHISPSPLYEKCTIIHIKGTGYKLPFPMWTISNVDTATLSQIAFIQLANYYHWREISSEEIIYGYKLVSDDNRYYYAVMAYGRFFELPVKIPVVQDIITDIFSELVSYYEWEKIK